MTQMFISYSRVDQVFVEQLYHRLQQMRPSASIWYDKAPHGLLGGDSWWDEITNAIASCDIFIYVLSNEAVQSAYCQAEFAEARRLQKQIITIQARDRTLLSGELRDIQYVDMKNGVNDADALAQLSGALDRQISQVKHRSPPLWQPRTPKPDDENAPLRSDVSQPANKSELRFPANEGQTSGAAKPQRRKYHLALGLVLVLALAAAAGAFIQNALTLSSTASPEQLALTQVASNADWQPYERDFDGVAMVLVPAGCFEMGDSNGESDQQPVETYCFDTPFWIDKYEVSNAVYGSKDCESDSLEPDQPQGCLNWFEAQAFCESRGSRLPTEAEWEYAARGPDSLIYPWGDEWVARNAVWSGNSRGQTMDVDSLPVGASWVGALHMSGNVWEWTSSLYEAYPYGEDHERDDESSQLRVLRGGSYDMQTDLVRGTFRSGLNPALSYDDDGVRCARSFHS